MPEIYNRLTGYKGIKVPTIPNLESNFFYHFTHTHTHTHTHTDPTFLSLFPHTSYLFVVIFPETELIESYNFCFAKYSKESHMVGETCCNAIAFAAAINQAKKI